jgi:glycosyltransferase involved in cell wall biosynthesis
MEARIQEVIDEIEKIYVGYSSQIIICQDRTGRGKGWAVRKALSAATGDIVCIIDGDMDIHPRMFLRMFPFLSDYDVIVGKKQDHTIWSRRMISRLSRWFITALFGLWIDTQTGIKMFKHPDMIPRWETDGFMYDVEVLYKCKKQGDRIVEVPIEANVSHKMSGRSVLKCLKEAIKIRMSC